MWTAQLETEAETTEWKGIAIDFRWRLAEYMQGTGENLLYMAFEQVMDEQNHGTETENGQTADGQSANRQ